MANTEIVMGEDQLNYYFDLQNIITDLSQAAQALDLVNQTIPTAYAGKASEEISLYFSSLTVHVQKLTMFYEKAMQFVLYAFQQLKLSDEEQAKIIFNQLVQQGYLESVGE